MTFYVSIGDENLTSEKYNSYYIGVYVMCSVHDLIEMAKSRIEEDVEIRPVTNGMQNGVMAAYDLHQDIIFYAAELVSLTSEDIIRIFMHELAHAKDFRSCATNDLIKILVQQNGVLNSTFNQADEIFRGVLEFQVSNFLYSEFDYKLRNSRFDDVLKDPNMLFSLIPSIEYLCFGEKGDLIEQFEVKLNRKLGSSWKPVVSFLKALELANELKFETEFLKLTDYLGFTVQIKTEPIENRIQKFPVLQDSPATQIKLFELVNFDINHFFNRPS